MATIACSKDYSIEITGSDCPDWLTVAWTGTPGNPPPENVFVGTGTITRTFIGGQFQLQVKDELAQAYYADALGTIAYTGAGCHCNCHVTVDLVAGMDSADCGFQIYQDATLILDVRWDSFPAGHSVTDIPFDIAASAGSTITIRGRWEPPPGGVRFWTFINGPQPSPNTYQVAITNI